MVKHTAKEVFKLTKETFKEFTEDNAIYYSAALSYYTIFALPPIIIIVITAAGYLFEKDAVSGEIYQQFEILLGPQAAVQIQEMVDKVRNNGEALWPTKLIGLTTLLFAATGVFVAIQSTLNNIWDVKAKPKRHILKLIKDRILSFALILSIAFLLLVSLVIHAFLVAFFKVFEYYFKNATVIFVQISNFLIPLVIITVLFAMIFKYLPDVKIRWKDVWTGAFVTSALFTLGKFLIGLYLGSSDVGSAYGAAGTIILILLWVFYSSILLFLGAEFTQVHARRYGNPIQPSAYAVRIEKKVIENQQDKKKL
ncbi:MAG: YihY/virulence factor BrkB family protein [Cytophagaceae bacterium]|nr:YihY/virulence factor BrkB family protein [Cytophagaceae bacterium]